MPELPDLEVFAKNLHARLSGKTLDKALYYKPNIAKPALEALSGLTLEGVTRDGKETRFAFAKRQSLCVHLMLNGRFSIHQGDAPRGADAILRLAFTDGTTLAVDDEGLLASAALNKRKPPVPDAFSSAMTPEWLAKSLQGHSGCMKAYLIDQKLIRGIGNAYADEILYAARISPKAIACKLPPEAVSALHAAIGDVLRHAIDVLLKHDADAIAGEYRDFLAVHVKGKRAAPSGAAIICQRVAGKTTYFTAEQIVYS